MSPAPSINVIILNRQCGGIIGIFKKRRTEHFGAPHLFSGQSPINWGITNRKRKYFSEKTTATLKSKQTSIARVGNHLRTVASLPTPLLFHYPLPLRDLFKVHCLKREKIPNFVKSEAYFVFCYICSHIMH
jgi:hypothetical protein